MPIVPDVWTQEDSHGSCVPTPATTNTNHIKSIEESVNSYSSEFQEKESKWNELAEQVAHTPRVHERFTSEELEVDESLSDWDNYSRILFSKLVKKGMRVLGQEGMMTHEQLKYELWGEHYPRIQHRVLELMGHGDAAGNAFTREALYQCERAARRALENFDVDTYRRKQAKGKAGGLAYRKVTLEHFLEMTELGLSIPQAAKHFEVSERTISNLRKKYRNINTKTGENE